MTHLMRLLREDKAKGWSGVAARFMKPQSSGKSGKKQEEGRAGRVEWESCRWQGMGQRKGWTGRGGHPAFQLEHGRL